MSFAHSSLKSALRIDFVDLRGSISNDSLSEDEIRQIEADRANAEAAAALREEDYQLAYAIDILKGLSAFNPTERASQ